MVVCSTCRRAALAFRESSSALAGRASSLVHLYSYFLEKQVRKPPRGPKRGAGQAVLPAGAGDTVPGQLHVGAGWVTGALIRPWGRYPSCGAWGQSPCSVGWGSGSIIPAHQLLCSVAFVLPGPSSLPCAELGVSVMLSWALSLSGGYKNPAGGLPDMSPPQAHSTSPQVSTGASWQLLLPRTAGS